MAEKNIEKNNDKKQDLKEKEKEKEVKNENEKLVELQDIQNGLISFNEFREEFEDRMNLIGAINIIEKMNQEELESNGAKKFNDGKEKEFNDDGKNEFNVKIRTSELKEIMKDIKNLDGQIRDFTSNITPFLDKIQKFFELYAFKSNKASNKTGKMDKVLQNIQDKKHKRDQFEQQKGKLASAKLIDVFIKPEEWLPQVYATVEIEHWIKTIAVMDEKIMEAYKQGIKTKQEFFNNWEKARGETEELIPDDACLDIINDLL